MTRSASGPQSTISRLCDSFPVVDPYNLPTESCSHFLMFAEIRKKADEAAEAEKLKAQENLDQREAIVEQQLNDRMFKP